MSIPIDTRQAEWRCQTCKTTDHKGGFVHDIYCMSCRLNRPGTDGSKLGAYGCMGGYLAAKAEKL